MHILLSLGLFVLQGPYSVFYLYGFVDGSMCNYAERLYSELSSACLVRNYLRPTQTVPLLCIK